MDTGTVTERILKGRAGEILADIIREIESLPGGYTLPSVRELQRRYQAGQQTILHVLDELDRRQLIQRFRRKGVRIAPSCVNRAAAPPDYRHMPSTSLRRQTTQLRMPQMLLPSWEPVVEKFNRCYPTRRIAITGCGSEAELFQSPADAPADFVLFPNNPCLLDFHCNTWQFMDLREMLNTLDCGCFYDALAVTEPRGRVIGVAPTLGITMLHCRPEQCAPPPPLQWNWQDFMAYGRGLRQRHPELDYACFLDGYIYYLYHSGQSLVHPETGRLTFSYDALAEPLERLKRMVNERIVPIFSDMYERELQYTLFQERHLAILEQASGWQAGLDEKCLLRPMPLDGSRGVLASEQFSIRASSMRYESCWEFIKFSLTEEVQKDLAERHRCFPVRRGIFASRIPAEECAVFENYLRCGARRQEDFHFPSDVRYVLEVGIDQWLKLGGNLRGILQNLEQSCQSQIDDRNR